MRRTASSWPQARRMRPSSRRPYVAGNTIAFNGGDGVTIGDNAADATPSNAVLGNSIFSNTDLGIDLGNNTSVTLNDSLGHSGPNNFQNFPVLTSATPAPAAPRSPARSAARQTRTTPSSFSANPGADPSRFGKGKTYLGQTSVRTNGSGNASFSAIVNVALTATQSFAHGDRPGRQHLGVLQRHLRPILSGSPSSSSRTQRRRGAGPAPTGRRATTSSRAPPACLRATPSPPADRRLIP